MVKAETGFDLRSHNVMSGAWDFSLLGPQVAYVMPAREKPMLPRACSVWSCVRMNPIWAEWRVNETWYISKLTCPTYFPWKVGHEKFRFPECCQQFFRYLLGRNLLGESREGPKRCHLLSPLLRWKIWHAPFAKRRIYMVDQKNIRSQSLAGKT